MSTNASRRFLPVALLLALFLSLPSSASAESTCGTWVSPEMCGPGQVEWYEGARKDEYGRLLDWNTELIEGSSIHANDFCITKIKGRSVHTMFVQRNVKTQTMTCAAAQAITLRKARGKRIPKGWKCTYYGRHKNGVFGGAQCWNGVGVGSFKISTYPTRKKDAQYFADMSAPRYAYTGCGYYMMNGKPHAYYVPAGGNCLSIDIGVKVAGGKCLPILGSMNLCGTKRSWAILIEGRPSASWIMQSMGGLGSWLPKSTRNHIGVSAASLDDA